MGFRKPEEIRHHLSTQAASGLSISSYCEKHHICYHTFFNWRKRYSAHERSVVPVSFARFQISQPIQHQGFEIVFANKTLLRIPPSFEVASLQTLINALR